MWGKTLRTLRKKGGREGETQGEEEMEGKREGKGEEGRWSGQSGKLFNRKAGAPLKKGGVLALDPSQPCLSPCLHASPTNEEGGY